MDPFDIVIWLLAGLSAGVLAGAVWSGTSRAVRWADLQAGILGAVVGGWVVDSMAEASAYSFLGAVCAGVLCALLTGVLLRRRSTWRSHG